MNLPSRKIKKQTCKTKEQISKEIADANTGVARRGNQFTEMQVRVWSRLSRTKRGRYVDDGQHLTAQQIADIWGVKETSVRHAVTDFRSGRSNFFSPK